MATIVISSFLITELSACQFSAFHLLLSLVFLGLDQDLQFIQSSWGAVYAQLKQALNLRVLIGADLFI